MKQMLLIIILITITATSMFSQERRSFQTYYEAAQFSQVAPGAMKFGLYGWNNPAINSYTHDFDALFVASTPENGQWTNFNNWGGFLGTPYAGYGFLTQKQGNIGITDYRLSSAFGSRIFSGGIGYGFTGGDKSAFGRSNVFYLGALYRPLEQLSIGVSHTWALDNEQTESVVDLAVRPIGSIPLTIFADMAIWENQNLESAMWSAGASLEVLPGIRLNGRYFENESINLGVDISLGDYGYSGMGSLNPDQKFTSYNTAIRFGAIDRTILDDVSPISYLLVLDLSGSLKYQSYQWFDNSNRLLSILWKIKEASEDAEVAGLVINATNLSANMEMMWEVREALKMFKQKGKQVIIYVDRLGLQKYHFASVADKIVMDPMGTMSLEGYVLGRSFYKNTLEKLDIGYEELRYFKYKSAVESFSRENMSDADREQRQAIVNGWYDISKKDISSARGIGLTKFDELANTKIFYNATEAIENDLIDAKGRWVDRDEKLKDLIEHDLALPFNMYQAKPKPFDDQWSTSANEIAVIYAIGACAMDDGIKARSLVNYVKSVCKSDRYKAIVLRVDSPGGDAMASDYIADVVRECKGKKPIIVSQGMVAGSGGYWLSMDGDKIVAAPMTITGSIGVISSWMYDKGAASELGITTDKVQKGKYADLGYSWTMPFIPIGLPVRNLNEDEKEQFKTRILSLYDDFTSKVAEGRNMTQDEVKEIAQGRVYTGLDGKEVGLVDEIGGLLHAIDLAKKEANIDPDEDILISEFPKPELFDFSLVFGMVSGVDLKDYELREQYKALIQRMESKGEPMPVIPLDYYDYVVEE